jgi:hypothetical protein
MDGQYSTATLRQARQWETFPTPSSGATPALPGLVRRLLPPTTSSRCRAWWPWASALNETFDAQRYAGLLAELLIAMDAQNYDSTLQTYASKAIELQTLTALAFALDFASARAPPPQQQQQ